MRRKHDIADVSRTTIVAASPAITLAEKNILNFSHAVLTRSVLLKNQTHHFSFTLVYNQSAILLVVTENTAVTHNISAFNSTLLPPAYTLRKLPHFVSRNT